MSIKTDRELAVIGVRLIEDAYLAWDAAEFEAEEALRAWFDGLGGERAYHAYRAAVDREEAAARDLERLHELTAGSVEPLAEDESTRGRV